MPLESHETNPDAEGPPLQSSVQKLLEVPSLDVPLVRPEMNPNAEGLLLQSLVQELAVQTSARDRPDAGLETEGTGDKGMSDEAKKEASRFWEAEEDKDWPEELRNVFRGFKHGKEWGGEAWMCCVRELIALE
jgi:hypothetical protein